ncbi:protein POLR1D [Ambystoma mexicanum]|uniref:protein POLR1D n=1 Tax=Ambystoma mexicanum TaxID=8296 RepID=UPI0037E89C23
MSAVRKNLQPAVGRAPLNTTAPTAGEEDLERKAVEELLTEAKRGKSRAETMGPMGWIKCPLVGANKRFLINTIRNTVPSHKRHDERFKEDKGDSETRQSHEEDDELKKHRSHAYKTSAQSRSKSSRSRSPSRSKNSRDKHDQRHRKR